MSSIFSTRRGFLYQDRFAVLTYLQHFQARDVREFYVDYPSAGQRSIDIKLIDGRGLEKVYEVKSGECFKLDRRKKESSEIVDALKGLYEHDCTNAKLFLIIRKGFTGKIAKYWACIKSIQGSVLSEVDLNWLHRQLSFAGSKDQLRALCQRITLADSDDDERRSSCDQWPDIEDTIISCIDDISGMFSAHASAYELPSEILMVRMLHRCPQYAGKVEDLHPLFRDLIIDFLAVRRTFDETYPIPMNRGNGKISMRDRISEEVSQWFGGVVGKGVSDPVTTPLG